MSKEEKKNSGHPDRVASTPPEMPQGTVGRALSYSQVWPHPQVPNPLSPTHPCPPTPSVISELGRFLLEPEAVHGELGVHGFHLQLNQSRYVWSHPEDIHSFYCYDVHLCTFIHSFIQQISTEPLVCAQHCAQL